MIKGPPSIARQQHVAACSAARILNDRGRRAALVPVRYEFLGTERKPWEGVVRATRRRVLERELLCNPAKMALANYFARETSVLTVVES